MAQFVRIATEPVPDLREHGIPEEAAAVVDRAMARDPTDRPSALELGELIQQAQSRLGLPVAEMVLHGRPGSLIDAPRRLGRVGTGARQWRRQAAVDR